MTRLRIGHGYDVHKLTEGRPLILGGVTVSYDKGLLGHSDADVLTHAIIDAMLGAAAAGDIGEMFADTDERWRGADSLELLRLVRERLVAYSVVNVDATVVAQAPKLSPYREAMRDKIAKALGTDITQVNVKLTTEEGLGFTGNREGIAAQAVVLLELL